MLEVVGEPFLDDEPIWSSEVYPSRVHVRTILALNPEQGVPVLDMREELTVFRDLDYDTEEPLARLNAARRDGQVRTWYLGTGLDPLTLAGEILTVLVIDAEVFDQVFADVVAWNSEGDVVFGADGSVGVPWRRDSVYRLLATEPLAPAAQACIELAWEHQDLLLGKHG